MKSKIKFDLTEQNDPCIIAEISHDTEDLRDKVAFKFIEELGYESNLLNITFLPGDGTKAIIRPVKELTIINNDSFEKDQIVIKFIQEELQTVLNAHGMIHLLVTINKYYEVEGDDIPMYQAFLYNPNNMHWKDGYYVNHERLSTVIKEICEYVYTEISNPVLKK